MSVGQAVMIKNSFSYRGSSVSESSDREIDVRVHQQILKVDLKIIYLKHLKNVALNLYSFFSVIGDEIYHG